MLIVVTFSVPFICLLINFLMLGIYKLVSRNVKGYDLPFYQSFAYPIMLVLFFLSFFLIAYVFSQSITSLLGKIDTLNQTIRNLAASEKVPDKLDVGTLDEIGELTSAVNLLIERTAYREIELTQREGMQKEYLNKLRHDINTPLTALRLQLFYMESSRPSQSFQPLYQQIQYIADLTNEVRLEATDSLDSSYILKEEVDMVDFFYSMVRKWEYLYHLNGISLRVNHVGDKMIWLSSSLWLQRLFDNILQNTLRHSASSSMEITITNGAIVLRDDGKGFDPGREYPGLGMKVVKDLSKSLSIDCCCDSGSMGTIFSFTLGKKNEGKSSAVV
nr:HAMP domain-containing sensor histidine kinase [Bacillus mediterraneensis]